MLFADKPFFGQKFKVNRHVLIPRIETEQLVREVIKINPASIVDVGTGSGCIAVCLKKNLPDAEISATDISEEALDVARRNAEGLDISFVKTNLLEGLEINPELIVANLPYIPTDRIPTLDSSVKDFEPHLALDGGPDGFDLYRELFGQIQAHLTPKYLLAEIDDTHGDIALGEVRHYFPKARAEVKKDVFGRDRILKITF